MGWFFRYLFALLNCLYVFTIGYVFVRNRILISKMCDLFGYQKFKERAIPEIKAIIPEVEITAITKNDIPIKLFEVNWVNGNVSLIELVVINKLLQQYKPNKIFEIGTFDGRTTLNLAANSPKDAIVYTLDLPQEEDDASLQSPAFIPDKSFVGKVVSGSRFRGTECENKIKQLIGDSATFNFSPYEESIDFLFIDGAHTYDYLLSDSEKAMKMLRGGQGIILWHDYSWEWGGVVKALNRLYSTDGRFRDIRQIKGTSLVCYICY